jgi:uncharacterized membrane protein
MRVSRILGAVAVTVAAVVSLVAPASAASAAEAATTVQLSASATAECYGTVISSDGGALACFNPTGEHLYICDSDSDGHHPGAWYFTTGGSWHNPQYSLGLGYCHDVNLDMAESSYITYQACNYEGTAELSCSVYKTMSADG